MWGDPEGFESNPLGFQEPFLGLWFVSNSVAGPD